MCWLYWHSASLNPGLCSALAGQPGPCARRPSTVTRQQSPVTCHFAMHLSAVPGGHALGGAR